MPLNLAIDGPVGAGKSSIADEVARRLGILHLDTGAMYRAVGCTALRRGVDIDDEEAVTGLCRSLKMTVSCVDGRQHTCVDGEDVTGLIRTPEVSMAASTVARYAGVRQAPAGNRVPPSRPTERREPRPARCLRPPEPKQRGPPPRPGGAAPAAWRRETAVRCCGPVRPAYRPGCLPGRRCGYQP